ncbi:MAG: Ig-like domain-containing protein [Actinomycetota bacterium]
MKKTMLIIGVAVAALFALAVPASAGGYDPGVTPGVSTSNPAPGSSVSASGAGCAAGSDVTVTIDGAVVGTGTAAADGTFDITFTAPLQPGTYVLATSCPAAPQPGTTAAAATVAGETAGGLAACDAGTGQGAANSSCLLTVGATTTPGAPGGRTLPRTGGDSLPLASIGAVLVALGGLAVLVARKRSATA